MADYAIVTKACSKIVSYALSRIKAQTMLWILFSARGGGGGGLPYETDGDARRLA